VRHEEFHAALEAGDALLLQKMWKEFMPHLPQPNAAGAEVSMHMARTSTETISLKARAYSHRWLLERSYPSQLPDRLKPSAERLYPRIVEAVGLSVNSKNEYFKPAMDEVRKSMELVVEDCYANGDTAPEIVRPQMMDAYHKTMKSLFGKRISQ
jgi:hypothetical protein